MPQDGGNDDQRSVQNGDKVNGRSVSIGEENKRPSVSGSSTTSENATTARKRPSKPFVRTVTRLAFNESKVRTVFW